MHRLEEMEETLSIIKQTETQSVSALENQLKRSKEILDKMEVSYLRSIFFSNPNAQILEDSRKALLNDLFCLFSKWIILP